jgi:mannose-6-phosphate isomerase-like protein (cupin superfamily)
METWFNENTVRIQRRWGWWEVLDDMGTTKIKRLCVNPHCELSFQRHLLRNEIWYVHSGEGTVLLDIKENGSPESSYSKFLKRGVSVEIPVETWHQLINLGNDDLIIIEIQHGEKCEEDDIERKL